MFLQVYKTIIYFSKLIAFWWHSFMYSLSALKLVFLTWQLNARRPDRCYWIMGWSQSSDVDIFLTQSWSSLIWGQSSCRFHQDTMARESPGGSPLSHFLSTFAWNACQLDINSLKGKKRKRWFKSRRYKQTCILKKYMVYNMPFLICWQYTVTVVTVAVTVLLHRFWWGVFLFSFVVVLQCT